MVQCDAVFAELQMSDITDPVWDVVGGWDCGTGSAYWASEADCLHSVHLRHPVVCVTRSGQRCHGVGQASMCMQP